MTLPSTSQTSTRTSPRSVPKMLRAVAVAVTLGATAFTAVPAQASSPSINFSLQFGGPSHWSPGFPVWRNYWRYSPRFRSCLSQRQIGNLLNRHGYRNISIVRHRGNIVEARATRGHQRVLVTVDACRGRILDVQRLRGRGWR